MELASSVLSTSLKKALSFRAVELGLRMPQSREDVDVILDGSVKQLVDSLHERVVEHTVAFPFLPMKEEIVEFEEQIVAVPVPQKRHDRGGDSACAGGAHQRPSRG